MDESGQQRAVDSLRDWSKWLIGLDFAAATGCVVVLQADAPGASAFLVLAISAFALSVVCSVLVVRSLASLVEVLPLRDDSGELTTIYGYRALAGLSLGSLVLVQMALFFLGVAFFLAWVV